MNPKYRGVAALLATSLLTVWGGCGGGPPSVTSSTEEATVKGTVTVKGQPAKAGEVIFDPSNYARKMEPTRTATIQNGKYEIKTLVGPNKIRLGGAAVKGAPSAQVKSWDLDVKSGENTFDIDVPADAPAGKSGGAPPAHR